LAEYLISLGSTWYIRRNSVSENQQSRLGDETRDNLNIYYGDLLDQGCLEIG
jgi:GDP-D-mannose dehydratase